ncbi:MAG: DNA repair protein RecN [Alphaproteobacteria bacterium]|nr:DNA repair protein RecN [Alphaproteobacteria bacterium]
MLTNLYISNIVLIEKLSLQFGSGLNIMTGETGAGKSILLDALSLALGARSDTGLIRNGCDMASVVAEFDFVNDTIKQILDENGIDYTDGLILRRTLSTDGKSRAWINDVPVSVKTLKQIGDEVVEIHGQFESHSLLDSTSHLGVLDEYALMCNPEFIICAQQTKQAYNDLHESVKHLKQLTELLEKAETERDFLEHNVAELQKIKPQIGEEEELASRRAKMMDAEKNAAILTDAVEVLKNNGNSLDEQICSVAHILERIKTEPNPYGEQIDKLYDAASVVAEISEQIHPENTDIDDIDSVEERLFALRALARKHRCNTDDLAKKLIEMQDQLNAIDNSDAELKKCKTDVDKYTRIFNEKAVVLSGLRKAAAENLRKQILTELPDLKLGSADFVVDIQNTDVSINGTDDVVFMIKTNPGTPFAPLNKIASGGELSRFMLALRVALNNPNNKKTIVFDELDTGISGATASAVGERLNKLAKNEQLLVITHSAQVAGFADKHFKISKQSENDKTTTSVVEISGEDKINEIARIISGAQITPESIATAKTLIKN